MCCCSIFEGSEEELKKYPLCECGDVHVNEDGEAVEGCGYSPSVCDKCGWSPCDGSC